MDKNKDKSEKKDKKKFSQTSLGGYFTESSASDGNGTSSSRVSTHSSNADNSLIDLTAVSALKNYYSQALASSDQSENQVF